MVRDFTGGFIGPVILAVGYMLFWQWVDDGPASGPRVVAP